MNRFLFLLATLAAAATPLAAQTGTIIGSITDGDGSALPGASVRIEGTSTGAAADIDGRYRIEGVAPGLYTLVASFIGYAESRASVRVRAGETTEQAFLLTEAVFAGEEIVVSGTLRPEKLTDTPATIEVITAADLVNIPTFTPGELLARQKGIDFVRAGVASTGFNVRGFNSNFNSKNLQVIDGRYSTLIATGLPFGPLSPVSTEDIQRQEVVLGPNGALFGPNAHNGLINIITKDPRNSEGTVASFQGGSQSLLSAGVRHAQVVNDNVAFKANLSYSSAEEFAYVDSVYLNRDGIPGNEGYDEYALDRDIEFLKGDASLYLTPRLGHDIILTYAGSNSTYLSPTNVGRNQIKDWRVHVGQVRYVSNNWFAQAYATFSQTEDTYSIDDRTKGYYRTLDALVAAGTPMAQAQALADSASLTTGAVFADDSRRYNAEGQYRNTFGALSVVVGVQWQRDIADSEGTYLLDGGGDDPITIDQVGGYAQTELELPAGFRAVGAVRVDDHEIYGTHVLPKGGLLYRAPLGTFRVTAGRGIAAPTILNLYGRLFGGLILGNADGFTVVDAEGGTREVEAQKVEELVSYETGFKGQIVRNRLFLDVNAYYNQSKNFLSPVTVIGVATHRGDTPIEEVQTAFGVYGGLVATYVNFGEFDTYGADIGLTGVIADGLTATLNYSHFGITFDEDDLENNDFNGDGVVNEFDHLVNAPENKGSLAINLNRPRYFGSVLTRWVEAYDYFSSFQIASQTRPDQTYRGSPIIEGARSTDAFNYGPLGGFVQVDLGAGYRFPAPQVGANLQVSAQVTNLFDAEVREFTASPFIGRLFSIGLRAEF
jgi:iron complex outermembrane receptor protein